MIILTKGDILNTDAEALVNTVNCVGVMGRGIALQFKKAFPENFKRYEAACKRQEVQPGKMFVYDSGNFVNPRYIINFPTKRDWKHKSRIEDIESGLIALIDEIKQRNIQSIAIPPLGCGLGGLPWSTVRPLIEASFTTLPEVRVYLFEPAGTPTVKNIVKTKKEPEMSPGRAGLICLIHRYLAASMDVSTSLLEVQKLMYFLKETGENNLKKLRFNESYYGPYSENLRHTLNELEGHFILGYGDGKDDPKKIIELKEGAIEKAAAYLSNDSTAEARFKKVTDLIEGFETPYGMELLSTTHWVIVHKNVKTVDEIIASIHAWNDHKRKLFPKEHIELAISVLKNKHWLPEGNIV